MGGQITSITQRVQRQSQGLQNKPAHEPHDPLQVRQEGQKVQFELRRADHLLRLIQEFSEEQRKFDCPKRAQILRSIIHRYNQNFQKENPPQTTLIELFNKYQEKFITPLLKFHEQLCFTCTGRHWQLKQWGIPEEEASVEEGNGYQIIKFTLGNPQAPTDHLQVIIYKYLRAGDGFRKSDKVRNMKIFKKPLSEHQLTNLILNHQYLVVECENSYWSFEKDTKKLIVQASLLLSDVRDRVLGEKRIAEMTWTWLGLREKWFPEVMYESNQVVAWDISQVRVFAQHTIQTSLRYNVFKANCKVYAQYIMRKSITEDAWEKNKTFFDFFNT